MSNFTAQIKITAPKEQVWAVLSDLGSIYKWNPGVAPSYSTSGSRGGEGATRHSKRIYPAGRFQGGTLAGDESYPVRQESG